VDVGRLLFPALRWDATRGFGHEAEKIEAALARRVGGFIIFGGPAEAVHELITELRARSRDPLLIGADLERGAGQQFRGATPLPPLGALGELDDLEVTRRAAALTAREARAIGVDWIYAPVADLDIEPRNPIVGSRAFGGDPGRVAAHVTAWVEGCRAGGCLSCVKHFPGHGRTVTDSHIELPVVDARREELEADLAPFRAALRAGVDAVMTAHVAFPALDPSGSPATLSRQIVTGLLRGELGFGGLVVTDALIMAGAAGARKGAAAVRAVAAGCDVLLYPPDLEVAARALDEAIGRELPEQRVREAVSRIDAAARAAAGRAAEGGWGREEDRAWALEVAMRSLRVVRGAPALPDGPFDLLTVDDDVGGPYPPGPRDAFPAGLREGGADVREVGAPTGERPLVVALYADIRGWKGRPGLSAAAKEALARAIAARADATVVLFGHPRLAAEVPGTRVLAAWGGEPLMQEAAARWLLAGGGVG
jgi:beta-glucosidase-like glycosyl hydrolase